ncbi:eukaryotic translation initiation factor 2-alpha kinase [Coemansia biformis]|uniref:Eukaryotic translation initiation factor 2-alpha kinase n=1 Tax=Coemansia biformis TaxID=1286918 RepID=A0A9W7Y8D0_9FUNG|nr:eukaryotic translation initiation factor 2-alpha kinase [Coemansia biformis]
MNWIVTLKRRAGSTTPSGAGGSGDGLLSAARYVFKVKNILRRVESEVPHDGLCEWLHADIAEQYRIDLQTHDHRGIFPGSGGGARGDSTGAAAGAADGGGPAAAAAAVTATDAAPTTTTPAGGGSAGGRGGGRLEVVVVDPQRKARHLNRTRHKQKTGLADRASAAVARVMADVRTAPVLAIDEGAEFVRRLAGEPSILSDSGYKRMTELSSAHHRAYIAELHTLLERYQRDGCTHVWLYAAKGDLAITYKL